MRIMPFMKRKKGLQFAGLGFDTGGTSLPIASDVMLGCVKIGDGVDVSEDGTISVDGSSITFSTNEKIIGKWIDGSNVYQKVIVVDSEMSSGGFQISHGIVGNLKCAFCTGCLKATENGQIYHLTNAGDAYNKNVLSFGFPTSDKIYVNLTTYGVVTIIITYVKEA